jgi:RNA processing factor Prp31
MPPPEAEALEHVAGHGAAPGTHESVARHVLQNLATAEASRAQLGLAHSYSRAKVKFNVNRQDNMIIQVPTAS